MTDGGEELCVMEEGSPGLMGEAVLSDGGGQGEMNVYPKNTLMKLGGKQGSFPQSKANGNCTKAATSPNSSMCKFIPIW